MKDLKNESEREAGGLPADSDQSAEIPVESLAERIRKQFTVSDKPYVLNLAEGFTLTFRLPKDGNAYLRLKQAADRFVHDMYELGNVPPQLKDLLPSEELLCEQSFMISRLSMDNLTEWDVMAWVKDCGPMVPYIYGMLTVQMGRYAAKQEEEKIEAKKPNSAKTT